MFKYIVGYKAKIYSSLSSTFCITAKLIHKMFFKMSQDRSIPSVNKLLLNTNVPLYPGTTKVTGDLKMTIPTHLSLPNAHSEEEQS